MLVCFSTPLNWIHYILYGINNEQYMLILMLYMLLYFIAQAFVELNKKKYFFSYFWNRICIRESFSLASVIRFRLFFWFVWYFALVIYLYITFVWKFQSNQVTPITFSTKISICVKNKNCEDHFYRFQIWFQQFVNYIVVCSRLFYDIFFDPFYFHKL